MGRNSLDPEEHIHLSPYDFEGKIPPEVEYAYLAGFLDGEGCWTFTKTPRIEVGSTYPPPLWRLALEFGGTVKVKSTRSHVRGNVRWSVTGERALRASKRLIPFLIEKREQAELVIQLAQALPKDRAPLLERLKALKHTEYIRGRFEDGNH